MLSEEDKQNDIAVTMRSTTRSILTSARQLNDIVRDDRKVRALRAPSSVDLPLLFLETRRSRDSDRYEHRQTQPAEQTLETQCVQRVELLDLLDAHHCHCHIHLSDAIHEDVQQAHQHDRVSFECSIVVEFDRRFGQSDVDQHYELDQIDRLHQFIVKLCQ